MGRLGFSVHNLQRGKKTRQTEEEVGRQGRQRKRWEDSIREWTGLEFGKSKRAVENGKMEKTGCKIICGAPTTLTVKGLMMMMMVMMMMMMMKNQTDEKRNVDKSQLLLKYKVYSLNCHFWITTQP